MPILVPKMALIVHKYGQVDLKKMVNDIKSEIRQYMDYLKTISEFIDRQEN